MSEMVSQVRPAVARIQTGTSSGTGVIFETQGQTGYLITNYHVVEGSRRVDVEVNDLTTYQGTVRGVDQVRDLAVVSICCGRFQSLSFGDASSLKPGDEVVAIGYALGLSGEATITRGIVSALRYDSGHLSNVIQTDAAINPGNSGGPMLSMSGKILGINTFRYDESESGRPAEGLGFAISEKTVQERIPALKTGSPPPAPTPIRRPQPTPSAAGSEWFGPINGELWHDPSSSFIKTEYANVSMGDFVVSVTFVNPYSPRSNSWDYGLILRGNSNLPFVQIVVGSDKRWALKTGTDAPYQEVGSGSLKTFYTSAGDRNTLWVAAFGKRGLLFVNGEFISSLDLSDVAGAGDVAVITGAYTGNVMAGAVTRFEDFAGSRLRKGYGPANGTLQKEPGSVAVHRSGLWTQDLVAEAAFVNPPGTDWDYGYIIRSPESNRLDVIGLTGNRQWFHKTLNVGDDEYTDVADGSLGALGAAFRSRNHLLLMAIEEIGLLLLNDHLITRLDLSHNLNYGSVSVMGDLFSNHQGSPGFEDFNVWTP